MGFYSVYLRNMVMVITIDVKLGFSIKVWDYFDCYEKFVFVVFCVVFIGTCIFWFIYFYK